MRLKKILNTYFEIQNEIRKSVNYHKAQNPGFKNLLIKVGQLCQEVRQVHIDTLKKEPSYEELNRELWIQVFDLVMLNREYDYLSMYKAQKLTNKVYRYSFWPAHQSVILQQILMEWHDITPTEKAVELLWLLLHSVYKQARMSAKDHLPPGDKFPSLKDLS